ncbi:UTRA domain-containing protein [Streptomyces sp. ISL-99]|nr:UTRA domain-containing protein [Streptomyces sp. ISL-99]
MGVVRRMAEIGITVSRAEERPEPGPADAEEAALLGVQRGALVTRIQRTYYSSEGRLVETADIVVPAALCEVVCEVLVSRQPDSANRTPPASPPAPGRPPCGRPARSLLCGTADWSPAQATCGREGRPPARTSRDSWHSAPSASRCPRRPAGPSSRLERGAGPGA